MGQGKLEKLVGHKVLPQAERPDAAHNPPSDRGTRERASDKKAREIGASFRPASLMADIGGPHPVPVPKRQHDAPQVIARNLLISTA